MGENNPEYEYPGTPLPIAAVEEPSARNSGQIGNPNQEPAKAPIWKRLTFWNVLFNFILAITTALLGLVAYWQLDATNTANMTSQEALRISQDSFRTSELDQRAWVGPIMARTFQMFDGKKRPTFQARIMNTGKSPALHVKSHVNVRAFLKDQPFSPEAAPPDNSEPATTILFPGQNLEAGVPGTPLNREMRDDVIQGRVKLYFFGKITYDDVFERTHKTTFCMLLSKDLVHFTACDTYNEAD